MRGASVYVSAHSGAGLREKLSALPWTGMRERSDARFIFRIAWLIILLYTRAMKSIAMMYWKRKNGEFDDGNSSIRVRCSCLHSQSRHWQQNAERGRRTAARFNAIHSEIKINWISALIGNSSRLLRFLSRALAQESAPLNGKHFQRKVGNNNRIESDVPIMPRMWKGKKYSTSFIGIRMRLSRTLRLQWEPKDTE